MLIRSRIELPAASADSGPRVPTIKCEHQVTDDGVELQFHDVIGSWWDDSTSRSVHNLLRANRGKPVTVSINSGGGYVFDGIAIHNLLVEHEGQVTTVIEGNAASIATIIAQAGDVRLIRDNATMMIHRAWAGVIGNAGQLRNEAGILDKVDQQLAKVYAGRSGQGTAKAWLEAMAGPKDGDGTWYTAEEAKAAGLVDKVVASTASSGAKNENPTTPTIVTPVVNQDPGKIIVADAVKIRLRMIDIDN